MRPPRLCARPRRSRHRAFLRLAVQQLWLSPRGRGGLRAAVGTLARLGRGPSPPERLAGRRRRSGWRGGACAARRRADAGRQRHGDPRGRAAAPPRRCRTRGRTCAGGRRPRAERRPRAARPVGDRDAARPARPGLGSDRRCLGDRARERRIPPPSRPFALSPRRCRSRRRGLCDRRCARSCKAAAKRAQMNLHLDHGLITEATAIGGALLHSHPDDKAAAEAVLHLLNRRLEAIDGDYIVLADRTMAQERPPQPLPGFGERLRTQCRVIQALIVRETRTRFGDAKLGYGWALLEPILHITMLSAIFSLMMQGRPPIGTHFFIFYFTGLVPYLLF